MLYTIRAAVPADIDTLVGFTVREAREAEGRELDPDGVRRGVRGGFEHPRRAAYWVAETADSRAVASASVVTEWSNLRGGEYWWIQSIYIVPEHRGSGLAGQLLDRLAAEAAAAGAIDLRLHVHRGNERARRAYDRCGFVSAPYEIMIRTLRPARAGME